MDEGGRNIEEIERAAAPGGEHEIADTDLGPVKDPDAEAPGESKIERSAEKADPTL